MKNIIKRCLDRSYQKPGSFNFNQFSILQQITSEEFFSREDKDSRLRLATFSFKCYTCSFIVIVQKLFAVVEQHCEGKV